MAWEEKFSFNSGTALKHPGNDFFCKSSLGFQLAPVTGEKKFEMISSVNSLFQFSFLWKERAGRGEKCQIIDYPYVANFLTVLSR